MKYLNINTLEGRILKQVTIAEDEIIFVTDDGLEFKMFHEQDCCESVYIESINGDIDDLVGTPITLAEEVSNYSPVSEDLIKKTNESNEWGSCTWTFYKLATIKGYVDIRWFGESNGYYSEGVDFVCLTNYKERDM